jgi:hypothetical protein
LNKSGPYTMGAAATWGQFLITLEVEIDIAAEQPKVLTVDAGHA